MKFILTEAKADIEKFYKFAGKELGDRFFKMKDRLSGSERDIYYWMKRTPRELNDRLNELSSVKTRKEKESEAKEGAELVAENDTYRVYHITTFQASQKYGEHTKWCITGSRSGWNQPYGSPESYYWDDYTSQGIKFYFFISKKSDDVKYALTLYPDKHIEIYDSEDDQVYSIPNAPYVEGVYEKFTIDDYNYLTKYLGDDSEVDVPEGVIGIGEKAFAFVESVNKVTLPSTLKYIESKAFYACTHMKEIQIPDSVESIGKDAFFVAGLEEFRFPASIRHIGDRVLGWTKHLNSVYFPDGIEEFGKEAFENSEISSVRLPKGLKKLGQESFRSCNNLTEVEIPDGFETMDYGVFYGCKNLSKVYLPNSIKDIGDSSFNECKKLKDVYYSGTEDEWKAIKVSMRNTQLRKANIHFNSKGMGQ